MDLLLALLRLALSVIFGVAGITKLLDRPGTREAVINFGAPKPLAPALALALPIAELVVALGLLFNRSAWSSALAGLLMLGLFVVAISVNLAQGRTHDCHCFGQLHSRPLGWPTLLRNVLFALLAIVVLWQFRADAYPPIHISILRALAALNGVEAGLLIVGVIAGISGLILWQRQRQSAMEVAPGTPLGLPPETPAPHFEIESYDGGKRSLNQLLGSGKPLLLLFTNPKCGPCVTLFQEIKDWQELHGEQLTIALISRGSVKDNFVSVAKNGLGEVLLQEKGEVAQLYGAGATPTAVVVNTEGKIASYLAEGAGEIRKLLASVLGTPLAEGRREE